MWYRLVLPGATLHHKGQEFDPKVNSLPIPHLWRASLSPPDQTRTLLRGKEGLLIHMRYNRCYQDCSWNTGPATGTLLPEEPPQRAVSWSTSASPSDHGHVSRIYLPEEGKNEKWEGGKKCEVFYNSSYSDHWYHIFYSTALVKKIPGRSWQPRTYSSQRTWNALVSHSQRSPGPDAPHLAVVLWLGACVCPWNEEKKDSDFNSLWKTWSYIHGAAAN